MEKYNCKENGKNPFVLITKHLKADMEHFTPNVGVKAHMYELINKKITIHNIIFYVLVIKCIFFSLCIYLSPVGISRYPTHSSPVGERKDFMLNFNGITSFHPSAGGYYHHHHHHHHHHQSMHQDVKPCVM